jgi:hypothetical protein
MFRVSLRELLIGVAVIALAIGSLTYASDTWVAIVAGLAMLGFFAAIVVAAVDRGPRQAFAIGFALVMLVYGLIVLNTPPTHPPFEGPSRTKEFDHWEGRLPTTRMLRYVHHAVDRSQWIDSSTGKAIPNFDPADPSIPTWGSVGSFGAAAVASFNELPPREQFMPIGHLWWGLLLGNVGGRFAQIVYARRTKDAS